MPDYFYTARDQSGGACSGTIVADSVEAVAQALRAEGRYPVIVRPVEEGGSVEETPVRGKWTRGEGGIRITRPEVIQFTVQLSIMVETGVPLSEALQCISMQCDRPNVRRLVEDLSEQVESGQDFSYALARHPRSFPRLFVALVRASEKSGLFAKLLNRAAQYLRDEQETLRRVKGALTYPAIMLSFAIGTTLFLLAFVLPRFTVIYANKAAALPLPTRVLMGMSDFVVGNWLALSGGLAAGIVGLYLLSRTTVGQRLLHHIQLHTPLLGPLYRKLHLSRGLRMIGTMAGAGVNIVDCVRMAHDLCGNSYFREMWRDVCEKIEDGRQLSEPLFSSRLVPRAVAQMIHSGEKSGRLPAVVEQIAVYSEQELKDQIANLTRYIEPAMIVIMGAIIGGVALALLLPVFTISRVVGH
jgi:type IV pilus assembly protein PilC